MEGGLWTYVRTHVAYLGEDTGPMERRRAAGARVGRRHTFPFGLLGVSHASCLKVFYLGRFQVSDYDSTDGLWLGGRDFSEGDRDLRRCWRSGLQHFTAGAPSRERGLSLGGNALDTDASWGKWGREHSPSSCLRQAPCPQVPTKILLGSPTCHLT